MGYFVDSYNNIQKIYYVSTEGHLICLGDQEGFTEEATSQLGLRRCVEL